MGTPVEFLSSGPLGIGGCIHTRLWQYNKNPCIRTKKLRTFEAEFFCYAPSKQEPSPV